MAETTIDVERIVREVLARLEGAPRAKGTATPEPTRPADELVLSCRVVTLDELEGRLKGVRRLVVPPRAVVTPSVRDELKRLNVTCSHASDTEVVTSANTDAVQLVTIAVGKRFDPAGLIGALTKHGIRVGNDRTNCLIEATDRIAVAVGQPDTLGLIWTRHVAAGLCLANRHPGVRAVTATDAPSMAAAAAAVGANVAIIDPTGASSFQLLQMATEFHRGGIRPCPAAFEQRLT